MALALLLGCTQPLRAADEKAPAGQLQEADRRGAIGAFPVAEPRAASLPPAQAPAAPDADLAAFQEALRGTLPLTPGQVKNFREEAVAVRRQVQAGPIKLVSRSEQLSFTPGTAPPQIRIGPRHVTSIAFLDSTGASWPVVAAVIGAPELFSVMQPGGGNAEATPTHILTITALEYSGASSLNVVLEGAPLPLSLALTVAGERADAMVSLRMDRDGPHAAPPLLSPARESAASEALMLFLDGTPPKGAQRLRYLGGGLGVEAWRYGGRTFLRTHESLTWPAWIASLRAGDGATTVYELPPTDALVLSERGRLARYRVAEQEAP